LKLPLPSAKPRTISKTTAATLRKVKMFWTQAPILIPKQLIEVSRMMLRIPAP